MLEDSTIITNATVCLTGLSVVSMMCASYKRLFAHGQQMVNIRTGGQVKSYIVSQIPLIAGAVCIMLSKNLSYNVLSVHSDTNGRLILLNLEINDKAFTIVNVYAPNVVSERISFFK